MRSNAEKKAIYQYTKKSKKVQSDNFCHLKVERLITKWVKIEKSPIFWKNYHLYGAQKFISHFGDMHNNISPFF